MTAILDTRDDLRHRAPDGERMRDSLFWNLIVPEDELGLQVYTFVNHRGRFDHGAIHPSRFHRQFASSSLRNRDVYK